MIRVLLVDDHALVRSGVRQALLGGGDVEVVAEAASGAEALDLASAHRPDVVVMDISLPDESGLTVTAKIRRALPESRVLMLTVHDHAQYVLECMRAGAQGYLRKDTLPAELREAVRRVHAGETFFSEAVLQRLRGSPGAPLPKSDGPERLLDQLTPREREVLAGIAGGRTNKQIAAALNLSPRTVESYRENLTRKLGITSIAGLTKFAIEVGLTQP